MKQRQAVRRGRRAAKKPRVDRRRSADVAARLPIAHTVAAPSPQLRQAQLRQLQRLHGNRRVQRQLLQRQDGGADAGGGAPDRFRGSMLFSGPNFDADYRPGDPAPARGSLTINMNLRIVWRDFSREILDAQGRRQYRDVRLTPEQEAQVRWTADERRVYANNLRASIESAWSGKYDFALNEAGFANYRTGVCVRVNILEEGAGDPHHTVTAYKIPEGLESFRSFVSPSDHAAHLDDEDVDETEVNQGPGTDYQRRVAPFGHDSADIAPVAGQIDAIADEIRPLQQDRNENDRAYLLSSDMMVELKGRATAVGKSAYNEQLGERRAKAVEKGLADRLGRPDATRYSRASSAGEENATNDPNFRRVDIKLWDVQEAFAERDPQQRTTAAHEAGHLFGLDDEYVEEEAPYRRFEGDRPEHYDLVRDLMGQAAADEVLVQDSDSIMSGGMTVNRGHYVYFLEALNSVSGHRWEITNVGEGDACAITPRVSPAGDFPLPDSDTRAA